MSAQKTEIELLPFRRSGREKTTIRCGTISGWTKHANLDEKPCDACAAAKTEYDHRRNTSGQTAIKNRLHAKAQQLARAEQLWAKAGAEWLDEYRDILRPIEPPSHAMVGATEEVALW